MTHKYIVSFAICVDADNKEDAEIKAIKKLYYRRRRERSVTQINDLTTGDCYS